MVCTELMPDTVCAAMIFPSLSSAPNPNSAKFESSNHLYYPAGPVMTTSQPQLENNRHIVSVGRLFRPYQRPIEGWLKSLKSTITRPSTVADTK